MLNRGFSKKLADVDLTVLEEILHQSLALRAESG